MSEPVDAAPGEGGEQTDDPPALPSPDDRSGERGPAVLAVMAALAALSTGMAIISSLQGSESASLTRDWWLSLAFATAALFGPAAMAALLGARALLRRRPWAPLLLLVVGTGVATAGLVILTVTVSAISGGDNAPYREFRFIFDESNRQALTVVAVLATLHALCGALEAAAGIMGRHAAAPHGPIA
jgi:hypothetical protein